MNLRKSQHSGTTQIIILLLLLAATPVLGFTTPQTQLDIVELQSSAPPAAGDRGIIKNFFADGGPGAFGQPGTNATGYDFEGVEPAGWSAELQPVADPRWHIENVTLVAGRPLDMSGALPFDTGDTENSHALWCGSDTDPVLLSPGYGNNWNVATVIDISQPMTSYGSVTFSVACDYEGNSCDYLLVEALDTSGDWIQIFFNDVTGPQGLFTELVGLITDFNGKIRFRFFSDVGWSDEDHLHDSDYGAVWLDNIIIDIDGTIVQQVDFEDGTLPANFTLVEISSFSSENFTILHDGVETGNPCWDETNSAWGFFDAGTVEPLYPQYPGGVIVYGPPYAWMKLESPVLEVDQNSDPMSYDFSGPENLLLDIDGYLDLPWGMDVYVRIWVSARSDQSGDFGPWISNNILYYGWGGACATPFSIDIENATWASNGSDLMTGLKVRIELEDGLYGGGYPHSLGILVDGVSIGVWQDEVVQMPVADFTAVPNPVEQDETITFDGSSSYHPDPGRAIVNYEWDLDGDGTFDVIGPITFDHIYPDPGTYPVRLRVTDDNSPPETDTMDLDIVVGGNVVFTPDPETISLVDEGPVGVYSEGVVCEYLGGATGPLYGYSLDVTWDPAVITADANDFVRPDNGPFSTAGIFVVIDIPGGVRLGVGLGGTTPGITSGELFKATFTAATGVAAHAESDLTFTLNDFRDVDNQPLTGFDGDDGLMIVDLVAPSVTAVLIENDTLAHTDDYVKDTDHIIVTATITDAGGIALGDIEADLTGLGGGSAVNPDTYDGTTATWDLPGVTCTPADGTITVTVTADDGAGNSSSGFDTIIADNTAPAVVIDITADPGHNLVEVGWTHDGTDVYRYRVYRGLWDDGTLGSTAYPEYDDLPADHVPARPAAGDLPGPGQGWVRADADDLGFAVDSFFDVFIEIPDDMQRGVHFYEVFAVDIAGNYSDPAAANDRATNYWLGDIDGAPNDGIVNIADITDLGSSYGLFDGDAGYSNLCDVGPTDDWSRVGIPDTDNGIDFEDLMIFSMNYGVVAPLPIFQQDATEQPRIAWRMVAENVWALVLEHPCTDLKGVNLKGAMSAGSVLDIQPGALCSGQAGTVFLRNIDANGLDAGLSLLGTDIIFIGSGELMRVTFAEGAGLSDVEVLARSSANQPLNTDMENTDTADAMPVVYRMAQNYPNPFNPTTMISFDLPAAQDVKLAVFGPDGRKIVTLVSGSLPAGFHAVTWNGRDAAGSQVASGIYFYRIEAGPLQQTSKMLMLK